MMNVLFVGIGNCEPFVNIELSDRKIICEMIALVETNITDSVNNRDFERCGKLVKFRKDLIEANKSLLEVKNGIKEN